MLYFHVFSEDSLLVYQRQLLVKKLNLSNQLFLFLNDIIIYVKRPSILIFSNRSYFIKV